MRTSDDNDVLIGQIVEADFEPTDYPGTTMLTIIINNDEPVGKWWLRMERIARPEGEWRLK